MNISNKQASDPKNALAHQINLKDDEQRATARLLQNLLIISLIATIGAGTLTLVGGFGLALFLPITFIIIFQIIGLLLLWRGQLLPAKILLPTSLFFAITYIVAFPPGYGLHDINVIVYSLVLILAGLTLGQRGMYVFAGLIILAIFGIAYGEINGLLVSPTSSLTLIISPFNLSLIILAITFIQRALINLLNNSAHRARASEKEVAKRNEELLAFSEGLEKLVQERTTELNLARVISERRAKQFESIAYVARAISSARDLDSLLVQITNVINLQFGFYHVGIFLLDTAGEYAVLSAANSIGGKRMLERNHRLKVGETGIIGFVTSTGRARVALDTGKDAVFFNNPDLPDTRSEIGLPLRSGEQIIGALDVQSTESNAFNEEDVNILSTLADQVSIAIQNARQFEETRKALSESDALSRQFVQTGWRQFTRSNKLEGIRHNGAKTTLLYRKSGRSNETDNSDRTQLKTKSRGATLSLPVKLRGEVIGSVDIRSQENRQWDQDELDIVTAIIERSAIAMENARLLAESQKQADKERTIGEISTRISAQNEVDELLKVATQELGRTLPGMDISIQLKRAETE